MADAGPSLHRDESGSSRIFAYAALTLYWAYPQPHGHPHWLLGVIQALVNLGVLPLVAICLLLISGHRYPPLAT